MRVYKLYYPIEDDTSEDDWHDYTWKDMWHEINVYTEAQLRKLCEQYIKDDTITPETYCDVMGIDFDTFDVDSLDLSKTDISTILDIFDADGYVYDWYDLPEYEPTYNEDGTYMVKQLKQDIVCDADGKPYTFETTQEANKYIENLNNLMNKN